LEIALARRVVEKMKTGQNNRMGSGSISGRREIDPLSRLYESNGPSVKIRGSALQVAEKYLQLARDAHTGSNPVATENYLQHAEHYFRLIADAKAAQLRTRDGGARASEESDPEGLVRRDPYREDNVVRSVRRAPTFTPIKGRDA
jgi:hypothetical protein